LRVWSVRVIDGQLCIESGREGGDNASQGTE
jgi:hypothetical protein